MKKFTNESMLVIISYLEKELQNKDEILFEVLNPDVNIDIYAGEILKIENNFEEDTCKVMMKGEEIHNLEDKYLYNLIYNVENNEYSLEEQDEYFEKISVKND